MNRIIVIISMVLLIASCKQKSENFKETSDIQERNKEAREDSLKLAEALYLQGKFSNIITANYETKAVESLEGEDAADDPAIWVNEQNPNQSLIIGTNKKAGLYVYDLRGEQLQFIKAGNINNVDLRNDFLLNNRKVALVAGSNRTLNTISLFYIDYKTNILSDTIANIKSSVDEVYGICMYKNLENDFFIFVNGKGGVIEKWSISSKGNEIKANLLATFTVNSQPEGMVADDRTGILYLGVEEEGIYKIDANLNHNINIQKIADSDSTNMNIAYDIEGLALYYGEEKTYLLASIQGNFSYAIFETGNPDKYITSFIIADGLIDGVEETDGIEVVNFNFNSDFPTGLFVVQDGFNYDGDSIVNQNFKLISWEKISPLINK